MLERGPVELLSKDRLIRGYDLEINRATGRIRLVKEQGGSTIEFDLTGVNVNQLDFDILAEYKYRGRPLPNLGNS